MTLLYGQAGTENSLNSIRQARLLAVFTILTVIFVSIVTIIFRLWRFSLHLYNAVAHICYTGAAWTPDQRFHPRRMGRVASCGGNG